MNDQQKKQVPLRLSPRLYAALAAWAEDDFRSVNGQIEYLLSECVRQRKKNGKYVGEEIDLPPELEHAGVGGVFGVAPLQRVDARVPDVPGRDEVGLTDTQGDGVGHLLQNVKELPDAGGLDALDLLVQDLVVVHTKMYSLSSGSWGRNTRCFSLYFFSYFIIC